MNQKPIHSRRRAGFLGVVLRTLLFSLLLIALTFTTLFASSYFTDEVKLRTPSKGIPAAADTLRAFTVSTGGNSFSQNKDFPGAPNLSAKEQRDQLDEIAVFAEKYGFNTIFYEAVPDGGAFYRSKLLPSSGHWTETQGEFTFFDPLGYLVNRCKEKGIRVYATVNTREAGSVEQKNSLASKNPQWLTAEGSLDLGNQEVQTLLADVAQELSTNYDIAGVLFAGLKTGAEEMEDPSTFKAVHNLLALAKERLERTKSQTLGILSDAADINGSGQELFAAPFKNKHLDFVVTTSDLDPVTQAMEMTEQLSEWKKISEETGGAFYSLHSAQDDSFTAHQAENAAWLERQYGSGGLIINSYATLNTEKRLAAISLSASFKEAGEANMPSFDYPKTLAITRPMDVLTLDSSWETYFITGTSVPGQTITCEGAEITPTATGLWGHQVKLVTGTNTFTFTQGDVSKTAKIVRPAPSSGGLTGISKSSVYPQNPEVVLEGEKLKLSCTVPAGGSVTAQVGGLSAELKPVANSAKGVATTYQALLDVSSLGRAGQITDIGGVTYKLNIDGMNSSQSSPGSVYVTGEGATPVAKMQPFGTMVNKSAANDGAYVSILRDGCVDVITENTGGYYGLSMGGYILKSAVTIPTGQVDAWNRVSGITLQKNERGEKLVINGAKRPSYKGTYENGVLTLELRSIENWENMNTAALQSELCESIKSEIREDGSVLLTFNLKNPEEFLGWDTVFEGTDMGIYLKRKPSLQMDTAAPLSEVTIVLDPGHGGTDPGAMGIPGTTGPAENLLNLANSYSLRNRLEAMGATVHILQEDTVRTLDERLQLAQKFDADFFISSHHNSTSEAVDSNTASGVEVYFWNDASQDFAQSIGENLSTQTGRKLRGIEQSWYRVTMMNACPAVLVESGFINNPSEYEEIANEYAMYRYGTAVADAVLQYLL